GQGLRSRAPLCKGYCYLDKGKRSSRSHRCHPAQSQGGADREAGGNGGGGFRDVGREGVDCLGGATLGQHVDGASGSC
ncbi:unnamed protein product, partial [Ectocarpus sp. 12 AP-2014]